MAISLVSIRLKATIYISTALLCFSASAQTTTLAQDLGYPDSARLIIIHADDLGMAHSINAASFAALTEGSVSSASIMVPTPWVNEVAAFAKANPEVDLGLHLTLTSEWENYRWGPMSRDSVATLLDSTHYFHNNCEDMAAGARVAEVERELRAQVEQALRLGIRPTHFDSHMACLVYSTPELFGAYLRVGRAYGVPAMASRAGGRAATGELAKYVEPTDMLVDDVITVDVDRQGDFPAAYDEIVRGLAPGVTVLINHPGEAGPELATAVAPQIPFGEAWRQADLEYFTSDHLKELLAEEGIVVTTWRELYAKWLARG